MGPFDSEPPSGSPPLGAFGASMSVVSVADQHVFLTCGSVLERNLGHRVSAMEWLAHEAEAGTLPDVLFLQEVLPNRLGRLEAIYDLHLAPASPGLPSARTSMLGFRRNLGLVVTDNREVFAALGTYAVCANIELANGSVIFASVHTSPSHVEAANSIGTLASRGGANSLHGGQMSFYPMRRLIRVLHC